MILSVIVPAYNEEKLLSIFIKEVVSYLEKTCPDYELLIVENGSQDKTLEIARAFSQKNRHIKAEHLAKPSYGAALVWGMKKAKGDYLVIFNVDFWDKKFIDLAKIDLFGYDLVNGSKNLPGSYDKRPLTRRLVTRGFNLLLKILFGFLGTDTHGIKALRREKILPVLKKCKIKTGIFDSELVIRAQRAGLKFLELPVEIEEIRPNRFGFKRILETPKDLLKLYLALRF